MNVQCEICKAKAIYCCFHLKWGLGAQLILAYNIQTIFFFKTILSTISIGVWVVKCQTKHTIQETCGLLTNSILNLSIMKIIGRSIDETSPLEKHAMVIIMGKYLFPSVKISINN